MAEQPGVGVERGDPLGGEAEHVGKDRAQFGVDGAAARREMMP